MISILQSFAKINILMILAGTLTLLLFNLMQSLISMDMEVPKPVPRIKIDDITIPIIPVKVNITEPPPTKIEEPVEPPPIEVHPGGEVGPIYTQIEFTPEEPVIEGPVKPGLMDGNILPLVQVQAIYPQRALLKGTEGYVILAFNVSKEGKVVEPRVLSSQPAGVFDRAALKAISRWKYSPKVENGKAVKMFGIQRKMVFTIED